MHAETVKMWKKSSAILFSLFFSVRVAFCQAVFWRKIQAHDFTQLPQPD
jgi:hypothetical protein